MLAQWNGFKVGEIKVIHHSRKYGKSKYGAGRIIKGFIDLITVTYLIKYMEKPLHLFGITGGFLFFAGFVAGLYLTYLWYLEIQIWNRPLLMLAVLLMVIGIQIFFTGFIGEMIVSYNKNKEEEIEKKIKKDYGFANN